MKTFKQFNEESRVHLTEIDRNMGGLGLASNVIGGTLNLAKKGINLAGRVFNSAPARGYYGYEAGKETMKSIKNKEPFHQTGFKAMQGYFAKKTGGLKRGLAGVAGQYLTPGDKSQQ
tara:strand:+ start:427 stop:777 length:351 start_codon:yes stop_codon:yes gene_type:complete